MADRPRRIRFVLFPRNPLDAEILRWLGSLPQSARGTEIKPYLTAALIEYIRTRVSAEAVLPALPKAASRMPAAVPPTLRSRAPVGKPRSDEASGGHASEPSRALAQHLLEDFS